MLRTLILLGLATAAFGQSPDTVLTQTLINEIRALRQDIEATTVTTQRVQIALYRLQSQTALVAGAQQRLDAARTRAIETQSRHKQFTSEVQAVEERIRNTTDANQKKEMETMLPEVKTRLEMVTAEEAMRRNLEVDAESQVRTEQARLADLQSVLDRLDKALDALSKAK